jgi:hypothetical protein
MDPACELQRLYESGIQFTLQPDAGCGFLVGHGDYLHRAENTAVLPTLERAVYWLMEQVHPAVPNNAIGSPKTPELAIFRRRLL